MRRATWWIAGACVVTTAGAAQAQTGRIDIEPDDVFDPRQGLEQLTHIAAEFATHAGDQDTSTGHGVDVTDLTTLSGGFPGA